MSEESRPSSSSPSGGSRSGVWEPPTPEALQKLLPKYEITALLGRGGMGAVYKGRQLSLDRPVAIKILSAELDEREQGFAERFKNEAKAMGQLNHPGIVSVHDFGLAEGGLLYIGMEFVAGTDVSRMIAKQKRLPPDHAMAITAHVCDALAYAHGKGIIHRDIKPANIMVGYDGVVKVADFGLAKMTQSKNSGLTQSGMAMGTLHYMAPEALMLGSSVDHRADIYAVGVMLYQMLTGKLPQGMFDPPSQQIPGLDPRYDDIVKKAIRDDREIRYQTVLELRADLDAILTQPVARVEAPETGEVAAAPAALPTQARPQRTASQTAPRQQHAAAAQTGKKSSALLVTGTLVILGIIGAAMVMLGGSGDEKTSAPAATAAPAQELPAVKPVAAPAAPKSWPTGPNYRSLGQFRAWSALPNDPAIDLSPLLTIRDVKQVHMHQSGWVVLRKNGTTVANAMGANSLMGIRRICPGYGANFALIDDKGQLRLFGVNLNDTTRQPPANLGPVKDAYIAPHYHVALQEDGKLVFWGKGFDGIKEEGNSEWKTKPDLPSGRKAVAISSSDISLAVKLDDGTLLAWHIDRGALKLPTELGPGKTAAFAITRNDLLAVPTDGSATLFWPLDVTKPVHRLPGNALAVSFLEVHRDVLGLDAPGRPFARPAVIQSVPAIEGVLSAIPTVKAEHISAHLQHGNNLAPRLIWYENDPAAAKSATPVTLTGWPADGPFFRQVGRFKLWSSEPSPANFMQLSRLKGVEDVKQVYQGTGGWVVLRENGEAITSWRPDEWGRKNVARICPGIHVFYGLIDREGGFEAFVPDADKFPDRKPPPGLKAQDAFIGPASNFALTPEGQITVWGKNFDGINQPPENSEWPARPVAPAGRRFTAISHTEFHLACQLDNQTLKLWRNIGPVEMPPSLAAQKFRQFETSSSTLYGILDNGLPVSWKIGDPQLKAVHGLIKANSVHATNGKVAVYFLTPEGRPHLVFEVPLDTGILDPVLPYIQGARSDLISIRVEWDGKLRRTTAYVIWFDEQLKPAAPVAATPAAAMPVSSPTTKPRSLDLVPDYVTRVANYQKARHAQLADLAGKYRAALSAAREEAKRSGVLADVTELDAAVVRITALADEMEKNSSATEVKPLPALPPLGTQVPKRLKDLRTIFDRELVKTESTLVTALDQSLAVVQTNLVKASELDTAKSLETRRKEIVAAFPKPVAEPMPSLKPAVTATAPVPASAAPPPTSAPVVPGVGAPVTRMMGRLRSLADDVKDMPEVRDLTDIVGVTRDQSPVSLTLLRADGSLMSIRSVYDATNRKELLMYDTIQPASGHRFTQLGRNGERAAVFDDAQGISFPTAYSDDQPPTLLKPALDATLRSMHGHALMADGSLVWWGKQYGSLALNVQWKEPPVEAHNELVALSSSNYLVAVVKRDGSVHAWNSEDARRSITKQAKNVKDVAVVQQCAYALLADGSVINLLDDTSVRRGGKQHDNVAWIKAAGSSLLCGLRDGSIVTDKHTAKVNPRVPAMLQAVGKLPPEHIYMDTGWGGGDRAPGYDLRDLRDVLHFYWIEHLAPATVTPVPATAVSSAKGIDSAAAAAMAAATKDNPFINSLGMKFVPVPGTNVLMCIHETRKGDYRAYAEATQDRHRGWENALWNDLPVAPRDDHPAPVNLKESEKFLAWISQKESLRYRLPTDREWSVAAGIGDKEPASLPPAYLSSKLQDIYAWGLSFPPPRRAGNFADASLKFKVNDHSTIDGYDDGFPTTSPVMSFEPNNLGIYDLAGNVWEWCADWYKEAEGTRVMRGGSFVNSTQDQLNASYRSMVKPGLGGGNNPFAARGFRCVIELP